MINLQEQHIARNIIGARKIKGSSKENFKLVKLIEQVQNKMRRKKMNKI